MEVKNDILWRVYLVYIFMCLFGVAVIAQVFRLQFVQGKYWRNKADSLTTAYKNIEAIRGNIYAADGSLLATSIPIFEVRMDTRAGAVTNEVFSKNVDSLAFKMAAMFKDKSSKDYRKELVTARREKDRYHLINKAVTYPQLKTMRSWPIFKLGHYKGGMIVIQRSVREKPFKILAARTIGYIRDGAKPVGIEAAFSNNLEGIGGVRLMQKISGGVWKPINNENEVDPKDGNDVVTTIDVNIQDVAEQALQKQLAINNAHHGCAVLMEVSTGEIRAIANLARNSDGVYQETYNYAMAESTEPGSTFKLASLISVMDDGFVNPQDTVNIEGGTKQYYDRVIRDTHFNGISKVTVQRAFEISSNVGISKIIQKYYAKNPQAFVDKLYSMNLNKPLALQLAGEALPRIKSTKDKDWSGTSLPYMSIGYEVRLTPMQILTFYNAVANNGKMLKPLFVKEIQQEGKVVESFKPVVLKDSICSLKTIRKAQQLLEGVVQNGTARNLKNASYHIAGKTGTAQIAYGVTGYKDSTVRYQASFVGYFPAENPKYTCIVVVNAPSNDVYYAAEVAGPIFKEIADKVYATRLDIHKEFKEEYAVINTTAPTARTGNQQDYTVVYKQLGFDLKSNNESAMWGVPQVKSAVVTMKETHTTAGKVPNVIGMGIKDALYLLENAGLKVKINGKGKVVGQSIASGTPTPKGSAITIQLG